VATADLEIRSAGELLGAKQSGLVAAVGFDTYARILEEAVAELRGQPIRAEHDPEISVDVPAFLPDDFIPDTGQRLELYRRLAQAADEDRNYPTEQDPQPLLADGIVEHDTAIQGKTAHGAEAYTRLAHRAAKTSA
jgi:transcription-repair coupling factor (superfamily II helicase)